jgi:hypothetical protein
MFPLLAIRKMQIKNTARYHMHPGKDKEELELSNFASENENWYSHTGK